MPMIDILGEPHVFAGKAEQGETLPRIPRSVHGTQAMQRFYSVGFSIQHWPPLPAGTDRNKRMTGANSWRHNAKVWVVLGPREQASGRRRRRRLKEESPPSTERKGHDSARRARHFTGWTFKRMSMISLDIRINCRLRGPYSEWPLF
jgi:hypothetical protein